MKTKLCILILGMIFLWGCKDEDFDISLGIDNVVLPDISENSFGQGITIRGSGFREGDILALSPQSGTNDEVIYMETLEVTSDHMKVRFPSTATKDSYGVVLIRESSLRALGIIYSIIGVMPDEHLRSAISELFPGMFNGEKICSSARTVLFSDGILDISDKAIESLEGLQYFPNIQKLICNNNNIEEIPTEILHRLTHITAQNTGLKRLDLATSENPNTTLVSVNVDGNAELDTIDLYNCYMVEQFSAQDCGLVYLDVRNYHSIWGGCLNYNGTDFKFSFSDDAGKERLLKIETWWMDSYYYNSGPVADAINKGVKVECYDWVHDYGGHYYSIGNYQKTLTKYGEMPDVNLREALKALMSDAFEGDKVVILTALNSSVLKGATIDLSNKGIESLEGLQYFCGYKHLNLDGNNLGEVELNKYLISTNYTAGPVDEIGIQTVSAKNAGLTKLVAGDQYALWSLDISNNPNLTYIDVSRCRPLSYLNASGCNDLVYLDARNLADQWTALPCDDSKTMFKFSSDNTKERKLLVEKWWMDGAWTGTNPCLTAKDLGVRIECYDYTDGNKNEILATYN
jgi:hypothetical protein